MLIFQKVIGWLALRTFASLAGGVGYLYAAVEHGALVRPVQKFANFLEDGLIELVPSEHQAVAGAVGLGDGLPLALFVLAALLVATTTSSACSWCGRRLRRHPREAVQPAP